MKFASWTQGLCDSFLGEILKTANYNDTISFAGGLPAQELFPKEELKDCFVEIFDEDGPAALQYSEALGYSPLRQWISVRHSDKDRKREIDNIIMTSGSQQGLSLVAQTFIDPGDVVLVESPTYLGALQAFQGYRPNLKMVPCDNEGIITEVLEKFLIKSKPKYLYVIPNYQNPTGRLMSLQRRRALVAVAKKYNLTILEDNPYGELRYEGESLPNLMDLYDNVIYLGTFSKVLSPGLRVGYILAQKEIIEIIERAKEGVDLFSNNLAQRAVYKYITTKGLQDHILNLRKVYAERRDIMVQSFHQYTSGQLQVNHPQGGLFVWARITNMKDSTEFLKLAQKDKVIFVPGTFFYSDGRISNEMRINFSCASPDDLEEGVKRIARAADKVTAII